MNTFWLKMAAGAVAIIVLIVVIGSLVPSGEKASDEPGFGDMVKRDRDKFLTKPEPAETPENDRQPSEGNANEMDQKPDDTTRPREPRAEQTREELTLYFKPLPEIEKVQAERLLNAAVPGRSMTRLPMNPGQAMVIPNCRRIIKNWPESWYAYRAKQILADLPEHVKRRNNVTEQEIDTSMYKEQRPGTQPYVVEQIK